MHIINLATLSSMSKYPHKLLLLGIPPVLLLLHSLEASGTLVTSNSRPAILHNFTAALAILNVVEQLAIGVRLLAAWALELEHIHKVFEFDVDVLGPGDLVAVGALKLVALGAAEAEEHLAILIGALLGIPDEVTAHLAHEMVIELVQGGRPEVLLCDHHLTHCFELYCL